MFFAATGLAISTFDRFRVEASSESLVLADDPAGYVYDDSRVTFGLDEYVFVTITRDDLFTPEGVAYVKQLTEKLRTVKGIASATSITEVPLFRSAKTPLNPLLLNFKGIKAVPKLTDKKVVLEKARDELVDHKMFGGSLINADGKTAAIVVTFEASDELVAVTRQYLSIRAQLKNAKDSEKAEFEKKLAEVTPKYRALETARKDERIHIVHRIRAVLAKETDKRSKIRAAGLPTIIVDMVDYIQKDLKTFGVASTLFLALFLGFVFRRLRWVILPLMTCLGTAFLIMGLFVFQDKRMTVVTGNIPSLLVVIGLAHAIHIIVRFREEMAERGDNDTWLNLKAALASIFVPCFYTALTTGVGFASLIVAGILPVEDFGIHMALGVGLAFALSFIVFPAGLLLLPPVPLEDAQMAQTSGWMEALAQWSLTRKSLLFIVSLVVLVLSIAGIRLIKVETRFIDYFRSSSPIYESLSFIDKELGGTTQFEVVLKSDKIGYFQSIQGLKDIEKAEAILKKHMGPGKPVGNVAGLGSVVEEAGKVAKALRPPLPSKKGFLLKAFVPKLGRELLSSYVDEKWQQARVVARIHDTVKDLDRNALIESINRDLESEIGKPPKATSTGVFILYTNMLSSLTGSQYKTTGAVFGLIFVMMLLLFRDLKAALLCMVPNALPIAFVLGLMGFLEIHLDMATVMIASISLGIAIDGTIHYTFRFREEFHKDGDAEAAVRRSHASIGVAIFYTTLTSIAGFWVLALSNFKPNIYFGVFTGVAMLVALFGSLTVLPASLARFKPFAKGAPEPKKAEPEATESGKNEEVSE